MNGITLVFPIVTALFILLFFLDCPAPKTAELGSDARRSFSRRDALVLGLIVIIYSSVAFYNLGDTKAPQSFYRFEPSESVEFDLGREQTVSSLMLYTGLNTGSYTVEYSHDGEYWYTAATVEQNYAALFKWVSAQFIDGTDANTRYIRLTADSELYLGECAVKGENGSLIECKTNASELFDEHKQVLTTSLFIHLFRCFKE